MSIPLRDGPDEGNRVDCPAGPRDHGRRERCLPLPAGSAPSGRRQCTNRTKQERQADLKTTLALRHVEFEDLGILDPILRWRGHDLSYVDVPTADLSDLHPLSADLWVVLGGPIGAMDDGNYPFLSTETELIKARLAAGKATLGICLGAQLMARALGARVYPGKAKEIGWAPVSLSSAGYASCLRHLADTPVLHWHGDTYDLPEGAVNLASTAVTAQQAFSSGSHALALQFHAEAAGPALERWFVGHTLEISTTKGADVISLRGDTQRCSAALTQRGELLFNDWLDELGL